MKHPQANIRVNIGELVLEGFSPSSRDRIAAEVQVSLGRLIAERGLPTISRQSERISGGSFTVSSNTGERIAEAIYRGLRIG